MLKKQPVRTLLLLSFILFSFSVNATTYYVSNSGNDYNSGTDPSSPWQTLNKVNSFKSFSPGDNILFNKGNTFYGSITVSNYGYSGSPVTFGAYGSGANPIITGFTTVSTWTNLGGNIWESANAVSTLSTCNMVAINGINTPVGRYPNTGFLAYQSHNGNNSITSSSLTGSPNWTGASVAIKKERYVIETGKVTGQSGGTISFSDGKLYTPTDGFGFFIQNDPRTLDQQNEWYYNPSTGKVRVYSVSSPSNVQVATVENVVAVSGTWPYNFNNISFRGSNSDAMNLHLVSSGNIAVKNCDISYAGGDGIYADRVTVDIEDNNISYVNSNGIEVTYTCPNSIIKNNTLKNIGVIPGMTRTISAGSILTTGDNALVQYNNIDSSGYNGIFFDGNNTKIRNNFINHSCVIKDDGAGIYTNGIKVGREISGNIVLNTIGLTDGIGGSDNFLAHGIHLDGGTKYVNVSGNTVSGCRGTGLFIQQTTDAIIKGNTSYDNGVGGNWIKGEIMFQSTATNPIQNVTLTDNIFFAKTMDQLAVFYYTSSTNTNDVKQFGTADNNYYTRPLNEDKTIYIQVGSTDTYFNLSTWKSFLGQDANSKSSPKPITDIQNLRFEYNATQSSKTIALDAKYMDVKGVEYNGVITLAPYTSAVLTRDGAITLSDLLPAVNPSNTVNGLDYAYYEASSYSVLPTFSTVTPVKTGTVTNFDISQANRSTSYSFNYSGYINVPTDGQYTFYTASDDGSSLYIDNILVVNNDGLHGAVWQSGVIGLQAGKHAISVGYFQESGSQSLSISYSGPGISSQPIPSSALYRVSGSNLLPAVNPSNTVNGLNYAYYEASSYSVLPTFSTVTPVKTG
ncbi:MAG: right-handed parallel beta-helix repeat-containing protein, partial [Ginsengibacter sp.]